MFEVLTAEEAQTLRDKLTRGYEAAMRVGREFSKAASVALTPEIERQCCAESYAQAGVRQENTSLRSQIWREADPMGQPAVARCPHCDTEIFGTNADIDSGLRKHIEYCPEVP